MPQCSIRIPTTIPPVMAISTPMERGSRWRAMGIAGGRMELGWAGRRLIMAPGTTTRSLDGALSVASHGAGYRTTTADGCSARAWAGFGARPVPSEAAAGLDAGDR